MLPRGQGKEPKLELELELVFWNSGTGAARNQIAVWVLELAPRGTDTGNQVLEPDLTFWLCNRNGKEPELAIGF